jgi:hypothetical protein
MARGQSGGLPSQGLRHPSQRAQRGPRARRIRSAAPRQARMAVRDGPSRRPWRPQGLLTANGSGGGGGSGFRPPFALRARFETSGLGPAGLAPGSSPRTGSGSRPPSHPVRPEEPAQQASRRACGLGRGVAGGSRRPASALRASRRAPHRERILHPVRPPVPFALRGPRSGRLEGPADSVGASPAVRDGPSRRPWRPQGLLTANGSGGGGGSGFRPPFALRARFETPGLGPAGLAPGCSPRAALGSRRRFETALRAGCGGLGACSPRTVAGEPSPPGSRSRPQAATEWILVRRR